MCCARDVKLENALLDGTHTLLKITDFGYAKTSADSNCLSLVGTPGYAGGLACPLLSAGSGMHLSARPSLPTNLSACVHVKP